MFFKKILNINNIIAIAILAGSVVWLYHSLPNGNGLKNDLYTSKIFEAKVSQIVRVEKSDTSLPHSSSTVQTLKVEVKLPDNKAKEVTVMNDLINVSKGNNIYVKASSFGTPDESFDIVDVKRQSGMFWLAVLFAGFSIAIGGVKGFKALIGLVASIAVVFGFIMPRILAGQDAVQVSLIASFVIVLVNIYLTDGLSKKSAIAISGIFITIIFTAWLTKFSIGHLHFTGYNGEESFYLTEETANAVSLIGILMAGIIISALGILDDVAVTQVAVVSHLAHANPSFTKWALFKKAMSVGRDHIAAVINTLALAYVGASLPLLLLLNFQQFSIGYTINSERIAAEIVTILISTTSLVLSVPITTFLASMFKLMPPEHDSH